MKRGLFVTGFLSFCILAGALTGAWLYSRTRADPPGAVLLLGFSHSAPAPPDPTALRAVWVAIPQPDWGRVHMVGLPPEVWIPSHNARLCDLAQSGDERQLTDAVAGLLGDVDRFAGVIAFAPESLGDLVDLAGGFVVLGSVEQDAPGLVGYLNHAANWLDSLTAQKRVMTSALAVLADAPLSPHDVAAWFGRHARSNLPEETLVAFWDGLCRGMVSLSLFPADRLQPFVTPDGKPAYRLLPPK